MKKGEWLRRGIALELLCIAAASVVILEQKLDEPEGKADYIETGAEQEAVDVNSDSFIKWVDFKVPYEVLCKAYELDQATYEEEVHIEWIPMLAYMAARQGGEFPNGTVRKMTELAEKLQSGETDFKSLTKDLKYYDYYLEAYTAVLGGMVGEYRIETADENGEKVWKDCYGLKAFSPIAKGFPYHDYDDFGASRSYGYARPHLGHDMMGQVGTPVIAIESGYVEAIGWNQYGGWRLGIRSFDKKRYYYYAHLRQNFPYCKDLKEGSIVTAGDVIGYMGHTGYSTKENVNNIKTTHLHWGLQLIFDESQKEGNNEIWIDCYPLTRFLYQNRSETVKEQETKEWRRVYRMEDPVVGEYRKSTQKQS
ncbi:MAG: M23 family metallopeptidase [Lachnospiraceae bacterium]|nr:M23 family metallopeptidase [Lachnospiraceae bacterium]